MKTLHAIALGLVVFAAGCGGSSQSAPTPSEPAGPRPVRIDAPDESASDSTAARPVRVEPSLPGQVAESAELADPPPVEAPTGP